MPYRGPQTWLAAVKREPVGKNNNPWTLSALVDIVALALILAITITTYSYLAK